MPILFMDDNRFFGIVPRDVKKIGSVLGSKLTTRKLIEALIVAGILGFLLYILSGILPQIIWFPIGILFLGIVAFFLVGINNKSVLEWINVARAYMFNRANHVFYIFRDQTIIAEKNKDKLDDEADDEEV